ncbi:hypothetical protein ACC687_38160, partial [Rhizobium ruizarguesonis]
LIEALNDYEVAVILISHDRHLIEATVDRLWLVNGGTVTTFDGDMDEYRDLIVTSGKKKEEKPQIIGRLVEQKQIRLRKQHGGKDSISLIFFLSG